MYQEKLRELNHSALTGIALGVALVVVIVISALPDIDSVPTLGDILALLGATVFISLIFMGVPYTWKLLGEKLPLSQAGTLIFWIVIFLLRMFISMGFSWIIFPLVYLHTYFQAKREKQGFSNTEDTDEK